MFSPAEAAETGVEPALSSQIECKIAESMDERMAAFALVYDRYAERGLIEPNRYKMRVMRHHLLPTTQIFIAKSEDEIIGTVTLIGDGQLGLPMEIIYGDEVNRARRLGLYVGEVSCLATTDVEFHSFLRIFVSLTRLMAQHARAHGMDQFLIATHPKHGRFYKRFMAFEQIGPVKEHPSVCNAPAAALCLDFAAIDRDRPACYSEFFGSRIAKDELQARTMPDIEIAAFEPVAALSDDWIAASACRRPVFA